MALGPVLMGIDGLELTSDSRQQLAHPLVGGVVLFARNFETRSQLDALVDSILELREPRLLLAVDQEGGRVQRFRDGFTKLPALGNIGRKFGENTTEATEHAYWHGHVMALEMLDAGIDISFAPVLDLDRGSSVIGDRAFSGNPATVIELGRSYVCGMHDAGMKTTGKHFPGHGSVEADSHVANVCDRRSLAEIEASDMQPFTALARELDAMMIAHVEYPSLDDCPAGYSRAWLHDLLRQSLAYQGVIFSDDLGMHAAKSLGDLAQRTRVSLEAGCDAVLVCQPEDVTTLLSNWDPDSGDLDVTAKLQALYGIPQMQRGSLNESSSTLASEWRQWRARLELLD